MFGTQDKRILFAAGFIVLPALAFVAGSQSAHHINPQISPPPILSVPASDIPPVPLAQPRGEVLLASLTVDPIPSPDEPRIEVVKIQSGDNLMKVLMNAGAERFDAHVAIQALQGVYDPRRDLRIGDELSVTLGPSAETGSGSSESGPLDYVLSGLRLPVSYDREVVVDRNEDGGFVAREVTLPLQSEFARVKGHIDSSLFVSARDAGVPISVLVEMIRIFSYDVDFQRDIWSDDSFEIMFERQRNDADIVVNNGDIEYAKLTLRGKEIPLYRFKTPDGDLDYFDASGQSVRKALMKTPIDGARLSSGFGKRKHPVLGYTKLHSGVDFAAPTGTPIYAAGDGTVERANRFSSYGNYIRIRHNSTYSTAYAHLNGFAKNIRQGRRVKQGQVIGYVGTTGRSTGPHLHYEVHQNGKKVNPLGLKLPSGVTLKGEALAAFKKHRDAIDRQFRLLNDPRVIAQNQTN